MASKRRKLDATSSHDLEDKQKFRVLAEIKVFFLPAGIQKARLNLFKKKVENLGGRVEETVTDNTTHIVVDDAMTAERVCKIMKTDTPPQGKLLVKSAWLSTCFAQNVIVDIDPFLLTMSKAESSKYEPHAQTVNKGNAKGQNALPNGDAASEEQPTSSGSQLAQSVNSFKPKPNIKTTNDEDADSDYVPSDSEVSDGTATSSTNTTPNTSPEKKLPTGKWICTQSSKGGSCNANEHITSKLEEMVKNYESTNDKWRAFGYQKAIAALKKYPKQITSWEEAKALPGVGSRLADKIWEIAQSGGLRKLKEFQSNEQIHVLKMFTDVWGAGPHTAHKWYQQGFRTLEDLKTKAALTSQQKVGVRLYWDLLNRMPREEAAEIEKIVREAAEVIQPGIIAQACGSYRRGKQTCGDVDILITHPDGHSHKGIFTKLIQKLKDINFLTDDLVSVEDNGNQKKYLGVCKLPGPNRKHRRLDIIVVPYEEYGCAVVYFTGSAHFNRSLRHLCKKMGMSLNEHALRTGVVRKGAEKIFEGTVVPTPTEESVFKTLGVPYRPPEERDH